MSDSPNSERVDADRTPERQPRFESVLRWVQYMRDNPPEVWGPQQNAVVDGQIESAQTLDRDAEDERRIRAFADSILADEDAE